MAGQEQFILKIGDPDIGSRLVSLTFKGAALYQDEDAYSLDMDIFFIGTTVD